MLLLVGCGKKDDAPAASSKSADTPATASTDKPADKPADPPPAKQPPAPDTSKGSCTIEVSGDMTVTETTAHTGPMTLNVFQWLSPDERSKMGWADEGLIMNCLGENVKLNILSKPKQPFPSGARKLKVGRGGDLTVMGQIGKRPDDLSLMKVDGTGELTTFDDKRIAGKLELTGDGILHSGGSKSVKINVTFDMQCAGLSGCK